MSWRGLCISSPARLDLRAGRLLLRREGEEDVALPPHGCVRLLQVTEKQYGRMRLLVGDMPVMEKEAATQLLLF